MRSLRTELKTNENILTASFSTCEPSIGFLLTAVMSYELYEISLFYFTGNWGIETRNRSNWMSSSFLWWVTIRIFSSKLNLRCLFKIFLKNGLCQILCQWKEFYPDLELDFSWRRKYLIKMEFFTILKCPVKSFCLPACFFLVIWQNMQNTKRSTAIIF